jgi:hypothetical protein
MKMKTLTPDCALRLDGWSMLAFAIFSTARSYSRKYGEDEEAAFTRERERGHATAYSIYTGSMITDDKSHYDAARQRASTAITLEDGELVAVEGEPEIYKVKVVWGNERGPRNSDPIHFIMQEQ